CALPICRRQHERQRRDGLDGDAPSPLRVCEPPGERSGDDEQCDDGNARQLDAEPDGAEIECAHLAANVATASETLSTRPPLATRGRVGRDAARVLCCVTLVDVTRRRDTSRRKTISDG